MATTTMNDLFSAIDAYMQTNGKGGKNYLATHIAAIFSDTDAPLNAKTGVLRDVANSLGDFRSAIMSMYKGGKGGKAPLTDFGTTLTSSNASFKTFSKKLLTLNSKITAFNNYIAGLPKIVTPSSAPSSAPSSSGSSALATKVMKLMYDYLRPSTFLYRNGIGVRVQNFGTAALNQITNFLNKEKVLTSSTTSAPPTIINKSKTFLNQNNIGNNSSEGSTGIMSVLTGGAIGLFVLGWIKKALDKSDAGKQFQSDVKTIISKAFTSLGEFLTSPETVDTMKTGFGVVVDSLGFLVGEFFSKVAFPAMGKLIDEAPTLAKGAIFGVILKLNKWTLGIFNFVNHFKVLDAFLKTTSTVSGAAKSPGKIMQLLTGFVRKIGPKLLKVLRFIPGLGFILSLGFAAKRIYDGDYTGGIIEILAGIAYQFAPTGIGVAIGLGLDAFNMFLDSKQDEPENKGKGKGSIILGLFSSARSWIEEKLGASMRDIPIIGGLIRFGDAVMKMKSDPLGGIGDAIKSLYYLTPLPQLEYALGMLDYFTGSNVAKTAAEMTAKVGNWFNPDGLANKVSSWVKNIWQSGTSMFNDLPVASPQPRKTDGRGNPIKNNFKSAPANNSPTIPAATKDEIVLAKNTKSYDVAMSKMTETINSRLDALIEVAAANIQATAQGSAMVSQSVVASAGGKPSKSSNNSALMRDPNRDFRNRVIDHVR